MRMGNTHPGRAEAAPQKPPAQTCRDAMNYRGVLSRWEKGEGKQHLPLPAAIPMDRMLLGQEPRSREMKPCHHPLSDSELGINCLLKCWADFLSCPPPPGSQQSRISWD